jgi:Cu-Zn family superoxide dismutase
MCLVALVSLGTAQDGQDRNLQRQPQAQAVELPTRGVAVLAPTEGSQVRGEILFQQRDDALYLTGKVVGLSPGLHGFHIHEYGDLRDPKGASAGDHFNPTGEEHGGPGDQSHHAGDFGNIEADQDGVAMVEIKAPWLKLHFVVGRSVVVHAGEDDLKSQPSGDAGGRAALGVIGIAEPGGPTERTTAK